MVDEEDHRKAKSKLAIMGKTIAEWIRDELKRFIKD